METASAGCPPHPRRCFHLRKKCRIIKLPKAFESSCIRSEAIRPIKLRMEYGTLTIRSIKAQWLNNSLFYSSFVMMISVLLEKA